MCGIIGYAGTANALPLVRTGLEKLDYRGYDSAGIALDNGDLSVYKSEGTVEDLAETFPDTASAPVGLGHTRWSTHGPPTDANAHPHTDCASDVAVVHNGIVQNYDELRAALSGHTFTSETDTEVIPHLLEEYYSPGANPVEVVRSVLDRLEGQYAFCAILPGIDGIVAARNDSPLVIGHEDDGHYLASDVTAFLEHTRSVTYLEDGDVVVVTGRDATVHRDGEHVEPRVETIEWEATAAEKGGYEHYMLKEIHEQPRALRQSISGRLDTEAGDVDLDLGVSEQYLSSVEEVQFVACGTSAYAARYAAQLLETLADVRASVTIASEYSFTDGRDPWETLTVSVTQSGETADTLSANRSAVSAGAHTLAVTNTPGSTITREVDDSVFIHAGPEIGVAATKTFATQVATLAQLVVYIGRRRGTLSASAARTLLEHLRSVPGAVQQVLDGENRIRAVAEAYADHDAFFFIGRNLATPVALEGALKLKEISYDHAEGLAAGELKHGPLALVTERTPVLSVLTEGAAPQKTLHNVKEVQARDAPVITAASVDTETTVDERFPVPAVGYFEPLVANVYWQLFAYAVAASKDRQIDKPRNLAKSVTVE